MLAVVGKITKTATLILMFSAGVALLLGVTASRDMQRLLTRSGSGSHGY